MLRKLICVALAGFYSSITLAQGVPIPQELHDDLWKRVDKNSDLTMEVASQGGEFSGCELVFYFPYRDYRSLKGEPVLVKGSISAYYQKGRTFGTLLKVLPQRLQFKDGKAEWVGQPNVLAALRINGKSMEKFRLAESPCELGGICIVYGDRQGTGYLEETMEAIPYDADIFFRFSKSGLDQRISLSELGKPGDSSRKIRLQFNYCVGKIVDKLLEDLK